MEISPDERRPAYSGYFKAFVAPASLLSIIGAAAVHAVSLTVFFCGQRPRGDVADAGDRAPIASGQIGRIFDRFYRADASRARQSGGTGLGLTIVRSIMRAHRGEVTVDSDLKSGKTIFTLNIAWQG